MTPPIQTTERLLTDALRRLSEQQTQQIQLLSQHVTQLAGANKQLSEQVEQLSERVKVLSEQVAA